MTKLTEIKSIGDWPKTRAKIESKILATIGPLPKDAVDLQVKTMDETEFPGFVRRKINYFADEWSRVSAWYFVPDGDEPRPAILCLHQTTPAGKDEPAGLRGAPLLAFAKHYAELGYVTLAPDCVTTGERGYVGLDAFDTAKFYKDFPKFSIVTKMLSDHMKCLNILCDFQEVDPARIGVIGHDLGALNALFLAAFDDRVRACAASCGITSFTADEDPARWVRESGLTLIPGLRKSIEKGEYPFDWDELIALIAPNPTLLVTALNDEVLSNAKSCDTIAKRAKKIYSLLGEEAAIGNFTHRDGHNMTQEAVDAADDWFDRWL